MIMPTTTLGPSISELKPADMNRPARPSAAAKTPASAAKDTRGEAHFDHPWVIAMLAGLVAGLVSALVVQFLTG